MTRRDRPDSDYDLGNLIQNVGEISNQFREERHGIEPLVVELDGHRRVGLPCHLHVRLSLSGGLATNVAHLCALLKIRVGIGGRLDCGHSEVNLLDHIEVVSVLHGENQRDLAVLIQSHKTVQHGEGVLIWVCATLERLTVLDHADLRRRELVSESVRDDPPSKVARSVLLQANRKLDSCIISNDGPAKGIERPCNVIQAGSGIGQGVSEYETPRIGELELSNRDDEAAVLRIEPFSYVYGWFPAIRLIRTGDFSIQGITVMCDASAF